MFLYPSGGWGTEGTAGIRFFSLEAGVSRAVQK